MDLTKNILFNGISPYDCSRMLDCLNPYEKIFKSNEIIHEYSHKNDIVGIIESGSASVVRYDINGNKSILEHLSKDSIFGESLAFSNQTDSGTMVISESECRVTFMKYKQITKRCSNACLCHTRLIENLFSIISMKTIKLSERVEVLSQRTTREKLLCYFNINSSKSNEYTFELPFNLSNLADYICVDRCAMMREIKKLKNDGIIEINKKKAKLLKYEEDF